jgi:hypothetical protein
MVVRTGMFDIERWSDVSPDLEIVAYRFRDDPRCHDEFESAKEFAGM